MAQGRSGPGKGRCDPLSRGIDIPRFAQIAEAAFGRQDDPSGNKAKIIVAKIFIGEFGLGAIVLADNNPAVVKTDHAADG